MGLPPWEGSDSQLFALVTGANSGLGYSIAARLVDEFMTSPATPPNKHLVLVLSTRTPIKSRFTISRLRAHLRILVESSSFATGLRKKAVAEGREYKWEDMVKRVHFLSVEVDLCDLTSVYALADQLVNGTVGNPDATTMYGKKLPYGSPGTRSYSKDIQQQPGALTQTPGSIGAQRSWGWGLSDIRLPRLDVIALNAGIGGWYALNFPLAIKTVLWDVVDATTWPRFKLARVGAVTKAQFPSSPQDAGNEVSQGKQYDPPLGEVFCSNVLGHYILAHELMPLLSQPASPSSQTGGRIIWISSIEAQTHSLSIDDIQGLKSPTPYESTKRLVDLLSLTSDLPSVRRTSASFYDGSRTLTAPSPDRKLEPLVKPTMYTTHPGVFSSDIIPLNPVLAFIWSFIALVARWMGSIWHPADAYKAAVSAVWLALAEPEFLDDIGGASAKWGSSTDFWGEERVLKTEVGGWGWDGKVGTVVDGEKRKGRHKRAVDLTEEARAEFEVLGGECWKQMEELRKEWDGLMKPTLGKK